MKKKLTIEDFKKWGAKGGQTKSKAKAEAVRANGAKGGRPTVNKALLNSLIEITDELDTNHLGEGITMPGGPSEKAMMKMVKKARMVIARAEKAMERL